MNTLVAAGFWMFWPTITALIQELTPGEEFVHANTFLLAVIQGGWLNAGWGAGAFLSALYAPLVIARLGSRRSIAISMGVLAICMSVAPLSPHLAIAVAIFGIMGSGRGISGVAMNTSIMEQVPPHYMGRVQNTFYFAGTALQIVLGFLVGAVAQFNLVAGFAIIGLVYAAAFISASWPVGARTPAGEVSPAE